MHQQQYFRIVRCAFHLNSNALRQSHEQQSSVDSAAISLGLEPWWHGSENIGRSGRDISDWLSPAEDWENGHYGCRGACSLGGLCRGGGGRSESLVANPVHGVMRFNVFLGVWYSHVSRMSSVGTSASAKAETQTCGPLQEWGTPIQETRCSALSGGIQRYRDESNIKFVVEIVHERPTLARKAVAVAEEILATKGEGYNRVHDLLNFPFSIAVGASHLRLVREDAQGSVGERSLILGGRGSRRHKLRTTGVGVSSAAEQRSVAGA
ncbi:hypothetical protein FAVG1_08586 [Fusarium avenaceum]|nr:hypothetical protein FAVG1_08586 [Fusarium avenaceum]